MTSAPSVVNPRQLEDLGILLEPQATGLNP